mmetsp:Transcript_63107/g.116381  ORF Transcript_63107/g.116381 Transcript_63107/m.116381 type:complete len:222 (+) Transcript_63107:2963-3628(+)
MGTALRCADRIAKGALLETFAIALGHKQLPSLPDFCMSVSLSRMEVSTIIDKAFDRELLAIKLDSAALTAGAGHVIHALAHKVDNVCLQLLHAKLLEVWPELDARVRLTRASLDLRLAFPAHVRGPLLPIKLTTAGCLNNKLLREYVRQLGPKSVAATSDLLLSVIVVVTGQQVAKDHLGYIDLVLLVDLDGQPFAIVPHLDALLLHVNINFDAIHVLVAL